MKPRVYADTSVIGGSEDDEFRDMSRRLLEAFRRGDITLVISELTLRELEAAPAAVRDALGRISPDLMEVLPLSKEAEDLAAVGPRMRADALHIALATVARVDVYRQPDAYPRLQRRQLEAGIPTPGDSDPTGDH